MPEIFVDSSGWGNLVDSSQAFHNTAATLYRAGKQQSKLFVTTNYILVEVVALLTSPLRISRPLIIAFVDSLKSARHVEIIHIDSSLDGDAWQFLRTRQDKDWSLVDCSSFVVMQRRGIQEALTSDHHFEQAGFVRLLK